MASTAVVLGVGLAAVGLAGRALSRHLPDLERNMAQTAKRLAESTPSKYYRGGFETQMTKREASLILGISPSASDKKIKDAHRRIMLANHPDKGGSPYLAMKINEAKDKMETAK